MQQNGEGADGVFDLFNKQLKTRMISSRRVTPKRGLIAVVRVRREAEVAQNRPLVMFVGWAVFAQ